MWVVRRRLRHEGVDDERKAPMHHLTLSSDNAIAHSEASGGAPGEFRHPDPLIKSQLLCL